MRELDIRNELMRSLRAQHDPADTLLVEELGLSEGAFRIDVAIVNGRIDGFEIKSEQDTLTRLPAQRDQYSKVFDRVTLVTGPRHLEHALGIIPAWWGVQIARPAGEDAVRLVVRRKGRQNPGRDLYELASLLWRDEALATLERRGLADGYRWKARRVLWQRLADLLPEAELANEVRATLKSRGPWRADGARTSGGASTPPLATG